MNDLKVKTFEETLAKHYDVLYRTSDNYKAIMSRLTPRDLAQRMTEGLCKGSASKDGEGIKRTCRELGIKYTYKAINEYFQGN